MFDDGNCLELVATNFKFRKQVCDKWNILIRISIRLIW